MTQEFVLGRIKEIAKQILPEGGHVWLYGSRARGNATDDSDWDLLITIDKDKITNEDHDKYAYPMTSFGWDMGLVITPILYSKSQWESYSFTPFYKNVEQDKVKIL